MRRFNVTGACVPEKVYMVDIAVKIAEISKLIDEGAYFTINRARQFGKTTTLGQLWRTLNEKYLMIFLSLEGIGDTTMASEETFCLTFMELIQTNLSLQHGLDENYTQSWLDESVDSFYKLGRHLTKMTKGRKLVLMIDEVDKISHNRVFLNFLGLLRHKFLSQQLGMDSTFHSVILTGVYDIKNIKLKLINEGTHIPSESENKLKNSPWNIATTFTVDMSFSPTEIQTMLDDYEREYQLCMDTVLLSHEIFRFTNGYPFLVSNICKIIDERLNKNWTLTGIQEAVKRTMKEDSVLHQDLTKNLSANQELSDLLYDVLILGRRRSFAIGDPNISLAVLYGYIQEGNEAVKLANKIFEAWISNYFIAQDERKNTHEIRNLTFQEVLKNGRFNMELFLVKFAEYFNDVFTTRDETFLERQGRLFFLLCLKPFLNGQGFYYIESENTDLGKMDVVVNYSNEEFIIELKRWDGEAKNKKAYTQLLNYMEHRKASTGYLLNFDFRQRKQIRSQRLSFHDKAIFEVFV